MGLGLPFGVSAFTVLPTFEVLFPTCRSCLYTNNASSELFLTSPVFESFGGMGAPSGTSMISFLPFVICLSEAEKYFGVFCDLLSSLFAIPFKSVC